MATGFKSYRSDGTVQIDDEYKTLTLKEVRTASISATGSVLTIHSFSLTASNLMIAVRCQTLMYSAHQVVKSGTSWVINFAFMSQSGTQSETVTFYIFTDPEISPGSHLNIYNSGGTLVFSDETRPIRIRSVVAGNSGYTGASGRVYAPVLLARSDGVFAVNGILFDVYYYFYRCSGDSIIATPRIAYRKTGTRRTVVGSYLVADVTNY